MSRGENQKLKINYLKNFDMASYIKMNFSMYGGKKENVKIKFNNKKIGVFIDRFGKDIKIIPIDKDYSYANVNVYVSNKFFSWLIGLSEDVKIIGPKNVVNEIKQYLKSMLEIYK